MIDLSSLPSFGTQLAPWVLECEHEVGQGWSPPRARPLADCTLPVASAAVQYALSVFEGLKAARAPDGTIRLFRPDAHGRRLQASARRLRLAELEPERFVTLCAQAVALQPDQVPPHRAGALYLRPTLSALECFLGIRASRTHALRIIVSPWGRSPMQPQRLWLERSHRRAAAGGLGATKTGANYAAGLFALESARQRGFDQVLFLDGDEQLSETASSNVFVVLDDRVLTPALDDTLLAGVTRDSCITLLRRRGLLVEERAPSLDELRFWQAAGRLREIFCTGTAAAVVASASIDGDGVALRPAGGALAGELRADDAILEGRAPAPAGWCVPVTAAPPLSVDVSASARRNDSRRDSAAAPDAGGGAVAPASWGDREALPSVAPRTRAEARAFADAWAAAWSRRDVEAVLAWFADDVRFVSPRALAVTGQACVEGKAALRDYWQRAVAAIGTLQFDVDDVTFDVEARRVGIAYRSRTGGGGGHFVDEQLTFGADGRIVAGAVFHGAPLD